MTYDDSSFQFGILEYLKSKSKSKSIHLCELSDVNLKYLNNFHCIECVTAKISSTRKSIYNFLGLRFTLVFNVFKFLDEGKILDLMILSV